MYKEYFHVKDLASVCNQLCEEGHGNAKIYIKTGVENLRAEDFEIEKAMYEDDTLHLAPDTPIAPVSQASSEDLLQELRCRDDWHIVTAGVIEDIISDMDDDKKLKLAKRLLDEVID